MDAAVSPHKEFRYAGTLSAVIALRMLGLFLILPVFMVLAQEMPDYSAQLAGLAVGIYGLTQAVLQQPFGWLSDRWGRRPVMIMGLALFAAGGVIAALADSIMMIIAGRALQGCGAVAGVAMAYAADLTSPERRPIAMAIIGMGIGGAFLLAMAISVPLSTLLGLSGLFWLTTALALLGIALVMLVPTVTAESGEESSEKPETTAVVWILSISVCLLHAVLTLMFVILPPMLVGKMNFALSEHWKLYVPVIILSVLVMAPLLRRSGRQSTESSLLPWAFAGLALALWPMSFAPGVLALGCLLWLYFLSFNLLESAMPSLLSRLAGSRGRGRRMGLYSTFQFLGAFMGGMIGGWLVTVASGSHALLLASLLCLVWGALLAYAKSRLFLSNEPV